jgi:hypothetical protein
MRQLALLSQRLRITRFHIVLQVLVSLLDLHSYWELNKCALSS